MSESAWAYLTVSADVQAESLPEQRAWADETAATNGWRIDRYFEAVGSGKHGVRKLMQTLLEELERTPAKQRPQRVLMVRVDRTGRGDVIEIIAAIAQIRKLGVTIHTRVDGDLRLETVAGSIKTIFDAIQAGLENEARSDRAKAGHRAKRKAGKHAGHAPYGIVLVDGKPRAYEPEAAIVREIFQYRLQKWGTHRLARYAARHAPPKMKADGSTRKMKWGENTIGRMLHCQTYRGTVVDESIYDAVQGIQFTPIERTAKYEWPLRGAIQCTCGHLLTTARTGNKKYRIRYYFCRNVAAHDRYPFHRADLVEAQFVDLLGRLVFDPTLIAEYRHPEADLSALMGQRTALDRDLADISRRKRTVWSLFEDQGFPREEVTARMAELSNEEKQAKAALAEIDSQIALANVSRSALMGAAEAVRQIAETWPGADVELQRESAKTIAQIVGGLYLSPQDARGASKSILLLKDELDGFQSTM